MLRHLVIKLNFWASWSHFSLPPKQCWFFYFFDCTDHSAYTTLNWGTGGIRELTLEANKIEQMLKYRKASFPKSVSTTFVAHCSQRASKRAWGEQKLRRWGRGREGKKSCLTSSLSSCVGWDILGFTNEGCQENLLSWKPIEIGGKGCGKEREKRNRGNNRKGGKAPGATAKLTTAR